MFPLLVMETLLYVPMNLYLLWTWIAREKRDTLVDKLICLQRVCGIVYCTGSFVDYYFRLTGVHLTSMSLATYCSCWMVFYKILIYTFQTSHLCMALVRFLCVKYPLQYHTRQRLLNSYYRLLNSYLLLIYENYKRFSTELSKKVLFIQIVTAIGFVSAILTAFDQVIYIN